MMLNQISATIPKQDIQDILAAIETIKSKLGFVVKLTPEERNTYARMGDKTLDFVGKSLEYAKENPQLVPPFLDVREYEKDMQLIGQLATILRPLNAVVEALEDTMMHAGRESYTAALTMYNTVRSAKNFRIPGTDNLYEELANRFPGKRSDDHPSAEELPDKSDKLVMAASNVSEDVYF